MVERHTDAAAVPVPDGGDDTLRDEMARTITASLYGGRWIDMTPRKIAVALLPLIREHTERAVEQARADERERVLRGNLVPHRLAADREEAIREARLSRESTSKAVARAETAEAVIERVRELAASTGRGVGYRVPGDRGTWGPYPEGRHDLGAQIEDILDGTEATP